MTPSAETSSIDRAATDCAHLAERFQLVQRQLAVGGQSFDLVTPRSVDELIDEVDFAHDERLPYWADVWPSSRVLAERVLGEPGAERRLLELGAGLALVSLAAARVGFEAVATDYYAEALEFVAVNARRNQLAGRVSTRLVDWRSLPDELGQFDVVAAADVLYERPQVALVAAAFARCLSPTGLGLLTDPSRSAAAQFPAACAERGLEARLVSRTPTVDGTSHPTIELFEIRRVPG